MENLYFLVPAQAETTGYPTYRDALAALDQRRAMNPGTELFVVRVLAHSKIQTVHNLDEFPTADPRLPPRRKR